jgi:hypothetical protein
MRKPAGKAGREYLAGALAHRIGRQQRKRLPDVFAIGSRGRDDQDSSSLRPITARRSLPPARSGA